MKWIVRSSALALVLSAAGCSYPDAGSSLRYDRGGSTDPAGDDGDVDEGAEAEGEGELVAAEGLSTNEGTLEVFGEADGALLEGDILIDESETPSIAGNLRSSRPWPNGVVHYAVAASLPNKQRVTDAIAHWESRTGVRFVARTNQAAYVEFVPGNGCSSYIGRTGGRQPINLASGCTTGSVIHEIGHAVGLWHEQSRSDRDQYVKVLLQNVTKGMEHNFDKTTFQSIGQYDLGSIMHYGSTYFSANGNPTMTRLDGSLIVPNRSALSTGDIAGIKVLYGDAAPTPAPPPGGVQATVLENLNLRAGPGTRFAVLTVMPAGSKVTRTGASQSGFDAVSYNGRNGWAYAAYLGR